MAVILRYLTAFGSFGGHLDSQPRTGPNIMSFTKLHDITSDP